MYYILEHTERESEAKLRALSSGDLGAQPPTSLEPECSRLSSEARQPSAKRRVHSLLVARKQKNFFTFFNWFQMV